MSVGVHGRRRHHIGDRGPNRCGGVDAAENAPVRTLGVTDVDIPTDTNVIVYCKSGWRASLSVPILHLMQKDTSKGFTGSWLAWTEAGKPVES